MVAPKKIGMVGAGTMGSGIAQRRTRSRLEIVLMDLEGKSDKTMRWTNLTLLRTHWIHFLGNMQK